jgi:plastocyanin
VRRSLITLAATALLAVAACSGSAATSAPTAAPSAAATTAPSAAPATSAPSAAASAPASAAGGGAIDVAIKNFTFNPASVDAKVGDKVSWTNGDDTAHTVTFDDAANGGSGNLNNGSTFDMTFAKAGTYAYHCKIHPSMKGTVTVS